MKQIKFRAPDDILDRLRDISEDTGIPQATIMRNGVEAELNRLNALADMIKNLKGDKK